MMYMSDGVKAVKQAVTLKNFMQTLKQEGYFDHYEINSDPANLFERACYEFWKVASDNTNPIKGPSGNSIAYDYEYGYLGEEELADNFWDFFYVEYPDDLALAKIDNY